MITCSCRAIFGNVEENMLDSLTINQENSSDASGLRNHSTLPIFYLHLAPQLPTQSTPPSRSDLSHSHLKGFKPRPNRINEAIEYHYFQTRGVPWWKCPRICDTFTHLGRRGDHFSRLISTSKPRQRLMENKKIIQEGIRVLFPGS